MKLIIAGILFLFIPVCATAASEVSKEVNMSVYSVHDGLSGNGVTVLFQDSKGYLWVGTQDGLNKYDGYSFTVYRHEVGNKSSISGNCIQCISEDPEGNLWIGTIGDGLNKWDRNTGRFSSFNTMENGKQVVLPEVNILGLSFDTDSSLWIKTDNYLLNYNTKSGSLNSYGLYRNIFKHQEDIPSLAPIVHHSDTHIWLGTQEGVAQFNKKEELYERITVNNNDGLLLNRIGTAYCILPLSDKSTLLGSDSGSYYLCKNDSNSFDQYKINLPEGRQNIIHAALKSSTGKVWIGTSSGLYLLDFDDENQKLSCDPNNYFNQDAHKLSDKDITCLIEDKSGLLWVGTHYNGLLKIDFKPRKFGSVGKAHKNLQKEIEHLDCRSIYVDESNKIWLGTGGRGIKMIDQETGELYTYAVNYSKFLKEEDKVLSMCEDSKKRLWIGTDKGIFVYYRERGTITEFSYADSKEYTSLLKENRINAIEEDFKGNIWFGTAFGLYVYDGYNIESYFSDRNLNTSVCHDEINAIYQDSEGILWIGTSGGVNFIDRKQDASVEFQYLQNQGDSNTLLSSNNILSIAEDSNGLIWFGTRSGVTYYDKISDTYGYYTHSDGLNNDMINAILCDQQSGVWLSTNKGISLINQKGLVYNFATSDGLPCTLFNQRAAVMSKDGRLYFGGVGGVAYVNPDSLNYNVHQPDMVITSVELFRKGKKIEDFRVDQIPIEIKYKNSSKLKVRFAALEFTEPSKNMFQVYLEGFDDEWRPVTFENEIDFSDLPTGEYVLHIKGANSDQVWCNTPISLPIIVRPALLMSNYAYAFYLIALVFLVQAIINYRIRKYRKAYKSLEEKAEDKNKIEAQRELLSKINQSLTDSIYYAKRIQESILPAEIKFKQVLPDSFVYFRPKDLVSGDFYWLHEEDDKLFVAAVDCTGHGVPGAFMSIIGYNMLKSIITSGIEVCPARILDRLSEEVVSTFKKDATDIKDGQKTIHDGMDIALCVIDKKKRKLEFAGAFNPLYLVRNNEVVEYKSDRFPIGFQYGNDWHYTKHELAIEPNDVFYIFSDGYVDQFGGPEGKKFKYRRFRHLLLNIHKLHSDDQKAILHQKLEEWMGDHEQVDDIIIIGMKPFVELV